MSTYPEKLSILSEMIAFARVDAAIGDAEYDFLLGVSDQLGVHRDDFDSLLDHEAKRIIPRTQADRILQFYRLVLLMNVDDSGHPDEIRRLHDIGLGMGLRPSVVEQVLLTMQNYPDKMVPPDVLIGIFKAHFN